MFAKDRDLLVLEPGLLSHVGWASQTLARGAATVSGGQLLIDGVDFLAAGASVGMVALVGGVAMEIVGLESGDRAEVSLIRASAADAVRPPQDQEGAIGAVVTFEPQIALVHGQLLRMLGVRGGTTGPAGELAEDRVVNAGELTLLEALGALHLVFASAAVMTGADSPAERRAELYRQRFGRERWLSEARLDTDGDGEANVTRRFNTTVLTRG